MPVETDRDLLINQSWKMGAGALDDLVAAYCPQLVDLPDDVSKATDVLAQALGLVSKWDTELAARGTALAGERLDGESEQQFAARCRLGALAIHAAVMLEVANDRLGDGAMTRADYAARTTALYAALEFGLGHVLGLATAR